MLRRQGMYIWFIVGILSLCFSIQAQAESTNFMEHPSIEEQIVAQTDPLTLMELAPLSRDEIIEKLKTDWNVHVKSSDSSLFDKYFLSFIYNYFQTMKPSRSPDTPYNLHSLRQSSQRLVSLRNGGNLYFSNNAGDSTITRRFKELMDALSHQTFTEMPDEIQMTFEYNNELYAQMNEAVLSSEDIKNFMNRQSGITFDEEHETTKFFTRNELLIILKQYLDLPLHIRDNLALKKMIRGTSSSIFATRGSYNPSAQSITLFDIAFEKEDTDDKGESTLLHEIGHALWGKSVWEGLSEEARKDYAKLSWHDDEFINDEFISHYSSTNEEEDFAEHFAAYINDGENLRHKTKSKYKWLREHIFLNTEYFSDVEENLKIFVESEHGDITPPYFIGFPYESIVITMGIKESVDLLNESANIKVEVSGLFDDLSKIKSMDILMQSENDWFWIKSPVDFKFCSTDDTAVSSTCVLMDPEKPGWYAYHDNIPLSLNYDGIYKMTQVKLKDDAGNEKILRSSLGDFSLPFPGTRRVAEEQAAKRQRAQNEAQRKTDAEKREAQRKQRELQRHIELANEATRKEKAAETVKGLNLLNLSELPIKLYQKDGESTVLYFGECLSITEEDLSSLSLEKVTGWFDLELDNVICSNTDEDQSKCHVKKASLIKQDTNGEYILADYKYEKEADFSYCFPSKDKKEKKQKAEEIKLKKAAEAAEGLNIFNSSESHIILYQNDQAVLNLQPQKCVSLVEQDLLSLTLRKSKRRRRYDESDFICSNIKNPFNLHKCNVTKTSIIKQNDEKEYILTDYQGEKSADFRSCRPFNTDSASTKDTASSKDILFPDQVPPYLTLPPEESISVSVEDTTVDDAWIKVEVSGLFDDMSQVKSIDIVMRSENDYFWLSSRQPVRLCDLDSMPKSNNEDRLNCLFTDSNTGRYAYYEKETRSISYSGDYKITEVELRDVQNNIRIIKDDFDSDNNTLFFPGRRLLISKKAEKDINEDLEIRTSTTADGDTLAHILTTDMTHFRLLDVYIKLRDTESGHELTYSINTNQLSSLYDQVNSPQVSGKMNLPVVIPKELENGKYRLVWISFERPKDKDHTVWLNKSNPNAYLDHISHQEDTSIAQPVVDDIAMEVLKGKNKNGKDTTSIKINVPIEGLDKGAQGHVEVIVRTPTGFKIAVSEDLTSHFDDSQNVVSDWLNLGSNPAEGEYMITHISTTEYYSPTLNDSYSGLDLYAGGNQRTHESRLLERGIRTTLKVSPPSLKEEKH